MRLSCLPHSLLLLLLAAAPASAASISTLSIPDLGLYDSEILSFTFSADGGGGGVISPGSGGTPGDFEGGTFSLLREVDEWSPVIARAATLGTDFSGASIVLMKLASGYTEGYQFDLAGNVVFTSYRVVNGTGIEVHELIELSADAITVTEIERTAVPEPASALLLLTGGAFAFLRRVRSSRAQDQ